MKRTLSRSSGLLGPPLAALLALLLAGLLLTVLLLARTLALQGAGAAQAAQSAQPESCYAWSFINQTGQDADGLEVALSGIPTVTRVYTGTANPFGPPAGVGAAGGVVTLSFGGSAAFLVGPADPVQVGACAPGALQSATFTWRNGGADVPPPLVAPGLAWSWPASDTLDLQVTNGSAVSLTLVALDVLDPGAGLTVDDLDAALASALPLVAQAITEPVDLLPGADLGVAVSLDAGADPPALGKRYLVHGQWAGVDDPNAAFDFFALVEEAAPRVLLPQVLNQQGN
jgi:hypothetical protein